VTLPPMQQQLPGLRRFLLSLESMNASILANHNLIHRRMWLEIRGLEMTLGRNEEAEHDDDHHNDNEQDPDEDTGAEEARLLRRLFGRDLPCCTALEELRIVRCNLAERESRGAGAGVTIVPLCRGLAAASGGPPSLRSLQLNGTLLGRSGLAALVQLLRSSRCALESLSVIDCSFGRSAAACDDLLTSLAGNRTLRTLKLLFPVQQGPDVPVAAGAVRALASSRVRYLRFRNFHSTALPALLHGLRDNCVLEELHLSTDYGVHGGAGPCLGRFRELLMHYNFALLRVQLYDGTFVWPIGQQSGGGDGHGQHQDDALAIAARRNASVRRAYRALQPRNFRLGDDSRSLTGAFSSALRSVATKPALVYQFLRFGNLDALDRHWLGVAAEYEPSSPGTAAEGRQQEHELDKEPSTRCIELSDDEGEAYFTISV
jgi:hypothetical protein